MEFRLVYEGRLKGNGATKHKDEIRKELDPQMRTLWSQVPLQGYKDLLPGERYEHQSPFIFDPQSPSHPRCICLISSKAFFIAEIDITLLRPDPPGSFVHSGDIDNRLKTLLDALRMPKNDNEFHLTPGSPVEDMYCLMEDDNLISRLSITTDRLLRPVNTPLDVIAIIRVNVKITRDTLDFMGLAIAM